MEAPGPARPEGCHSIAQPVMSDLQIASAMGHGGDDYESAILHSAADDRVCPTRVCDGSLSQAAEGLRLGGSRRLLSKLLVVRFTLTTRRPWRACQ